MKPGDGILTVSHSGQQRVASRSLAPDPAEITLASSLAQDAGRIWRLIGDMRRRYALGLSSLAVVNLTDVLAPVFLAVAIDLTEANLVGKAVATPPLLAFFGMDAANLSIVAAVIVFLALHVISNAARYPMLMHVAVPSHQVGQNVRNTLVAKLLALPQRFYDRSKSGDLMSRATTDLNATRMMLGPGILVGADTLLLLSFVIAVLFSLSWSLTLVALLPMPIIGWVTNKLSHLEYDRFKEVQEDIADLTERTRESYAGIRIIQGYARESFDRSRFADFSHRHFRKNLRLVRVNSMFEPTLDFMVGASVVLVMLFGGWQVVGGDITIGTFVAFIFLVGYLSGPMIGFGWSVSLFQRGRASMNRIDQLLAETEHIQDPANPQAITGKGHIRVVGLDFAYPYARRDEDPNNPDAAKPDDASEVDDATGDEGPPEGSGPAILHDINLDIPAGSTLGILGPVGSGKSTLMRLLVRLYDPPPGTVFLDGVDVRELRLNELRQEIVVAPQETFLFSDTVARNVALVHDDDAPDPSDFTRLAQLHTEIEELPDGYDTMLGERGVNLSGGQRQRLAIARAIATDPRILVLDDCLSAVDSSTEEAILHTLRDVFAGRTGIIVSHRVRALQACDHIVVLQNGRITEEGSHASLLEKSGYYAQIAFEQTREDDDGGDA